MCEARPSCLALLKHRMAWALALALARAGSNIAARMAIMAMTTSNSIKVKALGHARRETTFAGTRPGWFKPKAMAPVWRNIRRWFMSFIIQRSCLAFRLRRGMRSGLFSFVGRSHFELQLVVIHQLHDFQRLQSAVGDEQFIHLTTESFRPRTIDAQPAVQQIQSLRHLVCRLLL